MKTSGEMIRSISSGGFDKTFLELYPKGELKKQRARYIEAVGEFEKLYGENREICFISAPGRTEIGGNHTDHQHGRVLAASVNLDIICVVAKSVENTIRIKSKGYDEDVVDLSDLSVVESRKGKAVSLIRGVASRFDELGYKIGGFDAYTTSDVLKGSGLSSSAAFEVAVGNMLNHVFNGGRISAVEIAQIGQFAENVYFGKPSGLLDQTASSVGGFVAIDFKDPAYPVVEPVDFDFSSSGHTLCIVDAGDDHADLIGDYADIPAEMKSVANFFGKEYLRQVDEKEFYEKIASVRASSGISDRAVLRAMHFFAENERAKREAEALREGDFEGFKRLVIESGRSSSDMLQNVFSASHPYQQGISIALALSEKLLSGKGAWRVHGGGFAGTIQAFVPNGMLTEYRDEMEKVFGKGSCYELMIRPVGGVQVKEAL